MPLFDYDQLLLDTYGIDRHSAKRKRGFHRVMSGLTRHLGRHHALVFLTLTGSPASDFSRLSPDFQMLRKRFVRKFHVKTPYWKVNTREGPKGVIHAIIATSWIPKEWLISNWNDIHGAYIIKIKTVWSRNPKRLANYLVGYLSQQEYVRMSWSHDWVYSGFCNTWNSSYRDWYRIDSEACLLAWNHHLVEYDPPKPLSPSRPHVFYSPNQSGLFD